jgi:hypothetical protein
MDRSASHRPPPAAASLLHRAANLRRSPTIHLRVRSGPTTVLGSKPSGVRSRPACRFCVFDPLQYMGRASIDRAPGWSWTLVLMAACAGRAPPLVTPEQAQDRVYDHRSRVEAAKVRGNRAEAREHRAAARRYQRLLSEGRTATPEQALLLSDQHARRAEALQRSGRSRFVKRELERAATCEQFALRNGRLAREQLRSRAAEHRAQAQAYRRLGWTTLARHHRQRAELLESSLRTSPPPATH